MSVNNKKGETAKGIQASKNLYDQKRRHLVIFVPTIDCQSFAVHWIKNCRFQFTLGRENGEILQVKRKMSHSHKILKMQSWVRKKVGRKGEKGKRSLWVSGATVKEQRDRIEFLILREGIKFSTRKINQEYFYRVTNTLITYRKSRAPRWSQFKDKGASFHSPTLSRDPQWIHRAETQNPGFLEMLVCVQKVSCEHLWKALLLTNELVWITYLLYYLQANIQLCLC